MPYVLISTQIRLECGPTYCGDEASNPDLMNYLGATLTTEAGNPFKVYRCPEPPRRVLDKLERAGFSLVSSTGLGQTIVWTLCGTYLSRKAYDDITARFERRGK